MSYIHFTASRLQWERSWGWGGGGGGGGVEA